nr:hypothetical protein CFP56_44289 [Quercus suber]
MKHNNSYDTPSSHQHISNSLYIPSHGSLSFSLGSIDKFVKLADCDSASSSRGTGGWQDPPSPRIMAVDIQNVASLLQSSLQPNQARQCESQRAMVWVRSPCALPSS